MTNPPTSPPSAAGLLLMLSMFAGAGIGIAIGQPSAGLLIGVAAGVLIALVLWWRARS